VTRITLAAGVACHQFAMSSGSLLAMLCQAGDTG